MANLEAATSEWFDGMAAWKRGQRVIAMTIGVCFCAMAATAPLLWLLVRPARTSSSVPPPDWNGKTFRSGEAMRGLEKHVKEASWVTFVLRGVWNETLLQMGALENDRVVFGRDGWMFLAETLLWKPALIEKTRAKRREVLKQALDLASAVGIHLVIVPVPDKVTIYSEFLPADRPLQAGRERLYDEILDDIKAVGIPRVDLRTRFLAHKAAHPEQLLYFKRDTHWTIDGQLLAADAVKSQIEAQGWSNLVAPAPEIVVQELQKGMMMPGLVSMLGLRGEIDGTKENVSDVVRALMEERWWRPVHQKNAAGHITVMPKEHVNATVALCGTSFSESFGYQLPGTLGALVDQRCVVPGGGSFRGIRKLAVELGNGGFAPKIIIWEFVQRDYQNDWMVVKSLLQ